WPSRAAVPCGPGCRLRSACWTDATLSFPARRLPHLPQASSPLVSLPRHHVVSGLPCGPKHSVIYVPPVADPKDRNGTLIVVDLVQNPEGPLTRSIPIAPGELQRARRPRISPESTNAIDNPLPVLSAVDALELPDGRGFDQ